MVFKMGVLSHELLPRVVRCGVQKISAAQTRSIGEKSRGSRSELVCEPE